MNIYSDKVKLVTAWTGCQQMQAVDLLEQIRLYEDGEISHERVERLLASRRNWNVEDTNT